MNGEKWLQDRDPRQNSKAAQKSWKELGCTMFSITARSPDLNPIENMFHIVRRQLKDDTLEKKIQKDICWSQKRELYCFCLCTYHLQTDFWGVASEPSGLQVRARVVWAMQHFFHRLVFANIPISRIRKNGQERNSPTHCGYCTSDFLWGSTVWYHLD